VDHSFEFVFLIAGGAARHRCFLFHVSVLSFGRPVAAMFGSRRCGLFRVLGFHKGFQIRKAGRPERTVLLEPGIDSTKGLGIQVIEAVASFTVFVHQLRAPQQAQMLGDRRPGDRKRLRDLSGGLAAFAQQVEDGPARRVS